jgi:hypothetical protein
MDVDLPPVTQPSSSPDESREKDQKVLPVPAGPLRSQGPPMQDQQAQGSFWRRIKLRRRRDREAEAREAAEALQSKLDSLTKRLNQSAETLESRLQLLEHRLNEVWEIEEQLSHLVEIQEKLDSLIGSQQGLCESSEKTRRSQRRLAILIGAALVIGAAALALSL